MERIDGRGLRGVVKQVAPGARARYPIAMSRRAFLSLLVALAFLAGTGLYLFTGYEAFTADYQAMLREALLPPADPGDRPKAVLAYHNNAVLEFVRDMDAGGVDVLYFNDSVMGGHNDSEDRIKMSEMLHEDLGLAVSAVSGGGFAPTLFKEYAGLFREKIATRPKLAIMAVNPRAFSDGWFFTPRWMYRDTAFFTRQYGHAPTFGEYLDHLFAGGGSVADFYRARYDSGGEARVAAYFPAHDADRAALMAQAPPPEFDPYQQSVRKHFIENYATRVDAAHPMLPDALETLRTLRDEGVAVLAYITPIDHLEGEKLGGPLFTEILRANVAAIEAAFAKEGIPLINMAFDLPSSRFVDRDYACEHLNLAGRRAVVARLEAWLAKRGFASAKP